MKFALKKYADWFGFIHRRLELVALAVIFAGLLWLVARVIWEGLGGSACHVDDIKSHAAAVLEHQGLQIVGYEGFRASTGETYGGEVWYRVARSDDPYKRNYILFVSKSGDEYHIHNIRCIDCAIPLGGR